MKKTILVLLLTELSSRFRLRLKALFSAGVGMTPLYGSASNVIKSGMISGL